MNRHMDSGFFLVTLAVLLFGLDWLTDHDGQTSIAGIFFGGIGLIFLGYLVDTWNTRKK